MKRTSELWYAVVLPKHKWARASVASMTPSPCCTHGHKLVLRVNARSDSCPSSIAVASTLRLPAMNVMYAMYAWTTGSLFSLPTTSVPSTLLQALCKQPHLSYSYHSRPACYGGMDNWPSCHISFQYIQKKSMQFDVWG